MKLGKKLSEKIGKSAGANFPATIALIAVWLTTGLWHGASWAYVAWGGVNGLFIIFSMWMEPVYSKVKHGLRINESKWLWRAFQTVRTFALVTFIKVLPEVGTLSDGFGLWKRIFTEHTVPSSLAELIPCREEQTSVLWHFMSNTNGNLLVAGVCVCLLFAVSLIERKKDVRTLIQRFPAVLRWGIFAGIAFLIIATQLLQTQVGGFLYERF